MKLKAILFLFTLSLTTTVMARDILNCKTSTIASHGQRAIVLTLSSEDSVLSVGANSTLLAVGMMTNEFQLVTNGSAITPSIGNGLGEVTIDFTTSARGLSDEGTLVELEIPGQLTVRFDQVTGELTNTGSLRLENTLTTISPRLDSFYTLDQCTGLVDEL